MRARLLMMVLEVAKRPSVVRGNVSGIERVLPLVLRLLPYRTRH